MRKTVSHFHTAFLTTDISLVTPSLCCPCHTRTLFMYVLATDAPLSAFHAVPALVQWLNALNNHLASLPSSSVPDATALPAPVPPPFLLPDLDTAQAKLTQQHSQLTTTLQHAINTLRATNLELVSEGSTEVPTSTATPTKRRKTATPQQSLPRSETAVVEEEEASRVVVARAEVDNMLDEVNELLKKERLELKELHTFLVSHPSQHDNAEASAAGDGAGASGGSGAGKAGGGAAGGNASGSASGGQLSSPSGGHSKQVAAGLAKRLNRSAAM